MPAQDTKITALAAITTVDPANDMLPIVDVSDNSMAASGTTKRITSNQILGAGGTATLASATITGAATVGTTLGVTGVSTFAAGTALLPALTTTGDTNTGIYYPAADTFAVTTGGTERYRVDATGLGIGVSPTEALTVRSSAAGAMGRFHSTNVNGPYVIFQNSTANFGDIGSELAITGGGSAGNLTLNSRSTSNLCFAVNDSVKMRIDSSGNVGISVTPSAWASIYRGIQMRESYAAIFSDNGNGVCEITSNAYNDGAWKYANALKAARYQLDGANGQHEWYTAGTGTVGGTITDFATAKMTLDESGNLLVGTTGVHLAAHSAFQNNASGQVTFRNTSTTAGRYFNIGMESGSSMIVFNDAGVGVYLGYGTTSWGSTSDEKVKDIIEPISNAVAKVGSLRSVIGKFKTDSEGTRRSFLIAQDVQSVLPEAVDTSNADLLAVRYTEVIPLLVAAIKELTARVQTLEAK